MVETQFTLLKRGIRNNKRTTAMLSFSCVSYLEARDFSRVRLHLSKKPIERASFTFGGSEKKTEGYFITDSCIGCGSCVSVCPQNCIRQDGVPFQIEQDHCLHCGNCMNVCPVGAVVRR